MLIFLKGTGIVAIDEEQQDAMHRWNITLDMDSPSQWPRYMLYSLWIDKGIQFDLAGELKRWSKRLTDNKNLWI